MKVGLMAWSARARKGAYFTGIATLAMIAFSLLWLWSKVSADPDITLWAFLKIGFVVAAVWAAIGITMGIFIVMVLRRNERFDHPDQR